MAFSSSDVSSFQWRADPNFGRLLYLTISCSLCFKHSFDISRAELSCFILSRLSLSLNLVYGSRKTGFLSIERMQELPNPFGIRF